MRKILLVDDNKDFLKILYSALINQFETCEACNVDEALEILTDISVDLICSDYNLLDGTGLELLEQLYRNGKNIPFLLMSGNENSFVVNCVKLYGGTFCSKTDLGLLSTIKRMANV